MKKGRFLVLPLLLLLCCAAVPILAKSSPQYTVDAPYAYPVLPGTPEWAALRTNPQKLAACQIPEDILYAMTTEALVETVLNYPMRVNIYAYNSLEEGFEALTRQFNGLRELRRRPDAVAVLAGRQPAARSGEFDMKDRFAQLLSSFLTRSPRRHKLHIPPSGAPRRNSSIPLCLLSKTQPLRWVVFWVPAA